LNNLAFIEKLREQIPEEEEQRDALTQLREFSQWLLVVPLVIILLFGCGQLGLFTTSKVAYADTSSSLDAEYGPWPFLAVRAIRPEIVAEIKLDQEDTSQSDQVFNDPLAYNSEWLEGGPAAVIVVALAPTDEPIPAASLPLDTSEPASSTALPENTEAVTSTSGPSTTAPQTLSTSLPGSTNTAAVAATAVSTSSSTPDPTATLDPTATTTPTTAPTATSAPVNYCANINWGATQFENWQNSNTVWKFVFYFSNNNNISMYLTNYSISWSPDAELNLNRTKTKLFPGSNRPKLIKAKQSSPGTCSSCSGTTYEYPGQSGQAEIYNMFCRDWPCDESNANLVIPEANYSLTANATFTFYGPSGTVNCSKTWTASGMAN